MNRANENFDRETRLSAKSGSEGPNLALIAAAAVLILAIIFFFQNGNEVRVHFWFFTKTSKIRWTIITSVVFGIVIDRLFGIWWRRRRRERD
jgi:uncharacterized integral membrane protein